MAIIFGTAGVNNTLYGTSLDDTVYGLSGADRVSGLSGDDSLFGGSSSDVNLLGGKSADSLYGGAGDDKSLFGDSGNDRLFGGSGSDGLSGSLGDDDLRAGSGSDSAFGGSDADMDYDGANNDTIIVETISNIAVETAAGGADALLSNAIDYTLDRTTNGFFELVNVRTGASAARLDASDSDNTILGNPFSNTLLGRNGDDIMNGRGGTNRMTGGSGDDTVVVETSADVVRNGSGRGVDLVRAKVDFTLPDGSVNAFVEDLRMQDGFGNINGAGNDLDSTIDSNSGKNTLAGSSGDDHVPGGEGDDDLFGGHGADTFEGESGSDTLHVASGDQAFGGSGSDSFLLTAATWVTPARAGPLIGDFDGVSANGAKGEDKIVYATGVEVGSFTYIDGAAFSGAGNSEARYAGSEQIQVDDDGDGFVDQAFRVDGVTAASLLNAADFLCL